MERQTKLLTTHRRYSILGELVLVFTPVLILLHFSSSWVGTDPFRSFLIVWTGNLFMLGMIYALMKLRHASWETLGLSIESFNWSKALKAFGLSLLVCLAGGVAYLVGPIFLSLFTENIETADFSQYDYLKDNLLAFFITLGGVYFISSFGEEVIYRAFMITQLTEIFQNKKYGSALAIIISSIFFGAIHYQWGYMGMLQTGLMGCAMGISFVKLGKRLWILILAHAYMDTILLVQLYLASN